MKDNRGDEVMYLCLVCKKPIKAFYGRWGGGGTCSKSCEQIKASQTPKWSPVVQDGTYVGDCDHTH